MTAWAGQVGRMDAALLNALGVPTTYTPAAGSAHAVTGIFDNAYERVDAGEAGVSSVGPAVFYRTADLPSDPDADEPAIVIAGKTYRVAESQKDGQGGVWLLLHRTA